MLIDHKREKLLNAIIFFSKNTNFCGKTKLFKLLYYLDFMHFRETGRSVTGLDYFTFQWGPIPRLLFFEFKKMPTDLSNTISIEKSGKFTVIRPRNIFSDIYFTKREMKILQNVAFIFKEAKDKDMTEASHLPNEPWDKTIKNKGQNEKIDYFLALDNSEESLSKEEVIERIEDKEEIENIFNE